MTVCLKGVLLGNRFRIGILNHELELLNLKGAVSLAKVAYYIDACSRFTDKTLHFNYGHLAIFAGKIGEGTGYKKYKYLCSALQSEAS